MFALWTPVVGRTVEYIDPRDDLELEDRPRAIEEVEEISISEECPERKVKIGTRLPPGIRAALVQFLKRNNKVFLGHTKISPGSWRA